MSNDAQGAGEPIEINSCDDVLSHVFEFLDHETDDARREVIAEHLEDCSSCLREFGIEQEFKALVRRRCGGERERIRFALPRDPFRFLASALAVFMGQMIFLLVVIIALQDASWLDGTAFGLTILAVALVWQVFQVIAFVRSRRLAFDAPQETRQDGGSAT